MVVRSMHHEALTLTLAGRVGEGRNIMTAATSDKDPVPPSQKKEQNLWYFSLPPTPNHFKLAISIKYEKMFDMPNNNFEAQTMLIINNSLQLLDELNEIEKLIKKAEKRKKAQK